MNSLLTKFLELLPYKPEEMTVKKEFGKGLFILTEFPFYEDLFYDYSLNDPYVREIINIDEKYKIHKIRGGLKFSMNLNSLDSNYTLRCSMKQKTVEKSTELEVKYFPKLVNVGTEISVFQISGTLSNSLINYYKHMLINIFYYIQKTYYQQYINYYCLKVQNIISNINIKPKQIITKQLALKDIVPDLFLAGYVRSCSYPPSIITDDQKEDINYKNKDIMTYPKNSSIRYVCDKDKKKIYPGLRINDMENSEIYPAIPCCYQDLQDVPGSIRYKYEHDIPLTNFI